MVLNPFTGGTIVNNLLPKLRIRYPKNWVQSTSVGHMFEMNSTRDGEYIRLLNANGNFLNLDQDQNNSLVSYNDTYILSDHNLVQGYGLIRYMYRYTKLDCCFDPDLGLKNYHLH